MMFRLFTVALCFTGSLGLHRRDDPPDAGTQVDNVEPTPQHELANTMTADAVAMQHYEQEVMKSLLKASNPFECPKLKVVENFNIDTYINKSWYPQKQQPLIYNNYDTLKCVRADYRKKDDLPFTYQIEVFNQAVNIFTGERRGAGGDSGGMRLCSEQVDGAKLQVGPCDQDPAQVAGPYWVIHYEEGDDGFAIVAGGDPYVPILMESKRDGGGWHCGYMPLLINNSGLWFLSRKVKATQATFDKAKDIIDKAGLPWQIMEPVDHSDCDYLDVASL